MDAAQFQLFLDARAGGGNRGLKKVLTFESCDAIEWETWRANFILAAGTNEWGNARCRREIGGSMIGAAKEATKDIPLGLDVVAPAVVADAVLLLDAYQARFAPAAGADYARACMKEARQKEGEEMLKWHSRMRGLFTRAYPNMQEAELLQHRDLIEYFVLGLRSKEVKKATFTHRPLTYQAAFDEAANQMAAKVALDKDESKHPTDHSQSHSLFAMGRGDSGKANKPGNCHFCGKKGHYKYECKSYARQGGSGSGSGSSGGSGGSGGQGRGAGRGRGGGRNSRGKSWGRKPGGGRQSGQGGHQKAVNNMGKAAENQHEDAQGDSSGAWWQEEKSASGN